MTNFKAITVQPVKTDDTNILKSMASPSLDMIRGQVKMVAETLHLKAPFIFFLETFLYAIKQMGKRSIDDSVIVNKCKEVQETIFRELGISDSDIKRLSPEGAGCADMLVEPWFDGFESLASFKIEGSDESSTEQKLLSDECPVKSIVNSNIPESFKKTIEHNEDTADTAGFVECKDEEIQTEPSPVTDDSVRTEVSITHAHAVQTEVSGTHAHAVHTEQIELKSLDSDRKSNGISGNKSMPARPNSCPDLKNQDEEDIYTSAGSNVTSLLDFSTNNNREQQNSPTLGAENGKDICGLKSDSEKSLTCDNDAFNNDPENKNAQNDFQSNQGNPEGSVIPQNFTQGGARPKHIKLQSQNTLQFNSNTPQVQHLNRAQYSLPQSSVVSPGEIQPQHEMQIRKKPNTNSLNIVPHNNQHELTAKEKLQNASAHQQQASGRLGPHLTGGRKSQNGNRRLSYILDGERHELEERAQSVPLRQDGPNEREYMSLNNMPNHGRPRTFQSGINNRCFKDMNKFQRILIAKQENPSSHEFQSMPHSVNYSRPQWTSKSHLDCDSSSSNNRAKFQFKASSSNLPASPPEGAEAVNASRMYMSDHEKKLSSVPKTFDNLCKNANSVSRGNDISDLLTGSDSSKTAPLEGAVAACGRLVTDSSCSTDEITEHLPEVQEKQDVTVCGNHSIDVNSSQSDTVVEVEPHILDSSRSEDDLETDGSSQSQPSNQRPESVTPANQEAEASQSAEVIAEPIETIPEVPGQQNSPTTNDLERPRTVESETRSTVAARSEVRTEPLQANNRRALRAQRRQRQRRHRNSPPEGAADASSRSLPAEGANGQTAVTVPPQAPARSTEEDKAAMLRRFGIDLDEEDDLEGVDPEEVRRENARLKSARMCQVCQDKDASQLFLPCAHLSACKLCTPALTKCPQCRSTIRGIVNVYFG